MTRTGIQLGIYGYGVLGRRPEIRLGEVLDFVAGAGVDGVEVMSNILGIKSQVKILARHEVTVSAGHLFLEELSTRAERSAYRDALASAGTSCLILSAREAPHDFAGYRELAARVGAVIETFPEFDCLYHPHTAEYLSVPIPDGSQPLGVEVLTNELPRLGIVLDTYWSASAGHDPLDLADRWGPRSTYFHFKDIEDGEGRDFDAGTMPFSQLARPPAGAVAPDWVILEQDFPTTDVNALVEAFTASVRAE
jgi:sugar phosphate isomerase/epimerase